MIACAHVMPFWAVCFAEANASRKSPFFFLTQIECSKALQKRRSWPLWPTRWGGVGGRVGGVLLVNGARNYESSVDDFSPDAS